MEEVNYHIPALLKETIEALDIHPKGTYADVTFGGGGHSRAILSYLESEGKLYGFDRDSDAAANIPDDERFVFINANFKYILNFMRYLSIDKFDGILADLGVSFHHFDDASRGFSFRADAPLDMRMNQSAPLKASDIIADYSEEELIGIFKMWTDLKRPSAIAHSIVANRNSKPIETTMQLVDIVTPHLNPRQIKKDLAQVFQALRIETNNEMEALQKFLESTVRALKPDGRLAILTYHSIEDRMVKNFMKTGNIEGKEDKDFFGRVHTPWKLITRTPITADEKEVERNPRARSAKLRVAQLIANPTGEIG